MRKFLIRIFVFACLLFAVDTLAGIVFPRLVADAKGGDNWRNNYICDSTKEDVLVFGSSRAIHHYNPQIIEDSLGMSCYNCGQDGNGIILNYGRLMMIGHRYAPKVILLDVLPGFDLLAGNDNHKYLGWLRAYYDREGIPQIFASVDKTEKYKMMSNLYRYNSRFVQIVSDCVRPLQASGIKGYRPLEGEMDSMKVSKKKAARQEVTFDSLKLGYWGRLTPLMGSSRIVVVISPTWDGMDRAEYLPIERMCKEKGLPFINFADDPKYLHNYAYFKDGAHLNSRGADEFTRDLVAELRRIDIGKKD